MCNMPSSKNALQRVCNICIILVTLLSIGVTPLLSQTGTPIYSERSIWGWVRSHGVSGQMFLVMDGVGVFAIDTTTWTMSVVPGAPRTARILKEIGSDTNGDLLIVSGRDGSGGGGWSNRVLYRINSAGNGVLMPLPEGKPTALNIYPCGDGLVVACDLDGYFGLSSNGGASWLTPSDSMRCILNPPYAPGLLTLSSRTGKEFLVASTRGTELFPIQRVPSFPVRFGRDSIMEVISSSKYIPDTGLCKRAINDLTTAICTKRLTAIDGTSLPADSVDLLSTSNGNLFALERWQPGRLFHYVNGLWRLVGETNITRGGLDGYRSFQWWRRPDSVLCFLYTKPSDSTDIRLKRVLMTQNPSISDIDSGRAVSLITGYYNPNPASETWTLFTGRENSEPLLHSAHHGFLNLSAMARTIDFLRPLPILSGFTDRRGKLLVLPFSDCLYEVDELQRGHLRERGLRGELFGKRLHEPDGPILRSPTDYGLRLPWVDSTDVMFPGVGTRRYSRSGDFIEVLDTGVSSSAARLDDGTVVLGAKGKLILIRPDSKRDTVAISDISGFSPADTSCIVTTIVAQPNGGIVAFCSGMQVRDADDLRLTTLHNGGIVISSDGGGTWSRASAPQSDVWFLGAMRLPSGTLVASATGVIRDTFVASTGATFIESSNHTMDDRRMWRSTDNGLTWKEVLRQGASLRYFLVGGNGIVGTDGAALMVTVTGLMASYDDGQTWMDYAAPTADGMAQLISIFRSGLEGPVYYFTTDGAYRIGPTTSVHDRMPSIQPVAISATFRSHLDRWTRLGLTPTQFTNILGVMVSVNVSVPPTAGVYSVILSSPEGSQVETVCIRPEE